MATNRRRAKSGIEPGTIFGLAMTLIGIACLAIGFGIYALPS